MLSLIRWVPVLFSLMCHLSVPQVTTPRDKLKVCSDAAFVNIRSVESKLTPLATPPADAIPSDINEPNIVEPMLLFLSASNNVWVLEKCLAMGLIPNSALAHQWILIGSLNNSVLPTLHIHCSQYMPSVQDCLVSEDGLTERDVVAIFEWTSRYCSLNDSVKPTLVHEWTENFAGVMGQIYDFLYPHSINESTILTQVQYRCGYLSEVLTTLDDLSSISVTIFEVSLRVQRYMLGYARCFADALITFGAERLLIETMAQQLGMTLNVGSLEDFQLFLEHSSERFQTFAYLSPRGLLLHSPAHDWTSCDLRYMGEQLLNNHRFAVRLNYSEERDDEITVDQIKIEFWMVGFDGTEQTVTVNRNITSQSFSLTSSSNYLSDSNSIVSLSILSDGSDTEEGLILITDMASLSALIIQYSRDEFAMLLSTPGDIISRSVGVLPDFCGKRLNPGEASYTQELNEKMKELSAHIPEMATPVSEPSMRTIVDSGRSSAQTNFAAVQCVAISMITSIIGTRYDN